jgi:hypothetical protein
VSKTNRELDFITLPMTAVFFTIPQSAFSGFCLCIVNWEKSFVVVNGFSSGMLKAPADRAPDSQSCTAAGDGRPLEHRHILIGVRLYVFTVG